MKKIILTFCVSLLTVGSISFTSIHANTSDITVDVLDEFAELQEDIDMTLKTKNGQYIYDSDEIISIVKKSNLDFKELSDKINVNMTEDSFIEQVLLRLETTDTRIINEENVCSINEKGTYCGRNANANGWNYVRKYTDKAKSEKDAATLLAIYYKNMNDYQFDAIHAIQELVPSWAAIAMGIGSAGAAYQTVHSLVLSTKIRHANTGRCGTVVDVNIFTKEISAWSQDTFYV